MIYLASPYSSPIPELQHSRFLKARDFVAHCFAQRVWVFSPIVYTHEMARVHVLPTDAATWVQFNSDMLRHSEAMFVLHIQGWDKSKGVALEMKQAAAMFIPVVHYNEDYAPLLELNGGEQ